MAKEFKRNPVADHKYNGHRDREHDEVRVLSIASDRSAFSHVA
eukprot:COSAG01_NODE_17199_length_1170_cov_23.229692_2_plen_42_part_01